MPTGNGKTVSIPENSVKIPRIPKPIVGPPVTAKPERLSPGVYRNSMGMLVNHSGNPLDSRGQASNVRRLPGASVARRIADGLNDVSAGGNPNFDEKTGQFDNKAQQDALAAATRAVLGGANQSPPQPGTPPTSKDQSAADAYIRDMARRSQSPSQSALEGAMRGRPLAPNERAKFGIDPRDPNQYTVGPDGKLFGTLMGWRNDSRPLSDLVGTLRGLTGSPQQPGADEQRLLDILAKIRI
jgi:hypothetical protein